MAKGNDFIVVFLVSAVATMLAALPASAVVPEPFPADWEGSLFVQPADDSPTELDESVSALTTEEALDYMDELADPPLLEAMSVPCAPGVVRERSRRALGALLAGTPADLRGTQYRAPWFQAFPWTKSFPEAADASGVLYRWNKLGTVGKVRSTSPWPLWQNPGAPPVDDASRVAVALAFLQDQKDLILLRRRAE